MKAGNMNSIKNIFILILLIFGITNGLLAQATPEVMPGVIRVKFTRETAAKFQNVQLPTAANYVAETGVSQIDNLNSSLNISNFRRVFPFSVQHEEKHRKYGLHLWYEINFDQTVSPNSMVDNYEEIEGVSLAKPVYKKERLDGNVEPTYIKESSHATDNDYPFNDPLLPSQWHYENFGDVKGSEDSDIDLFAAWERQTGSADVIVAIVDGGVDYNHEDLADAMWINEAERNGESGVDDDQNGFVDDIFGYNFFQGGPVSGVTHGTHVGGTVGAVNNNGIGLGGVAGGDGVNPGVRLMSCQVYNAQGIGGGHAQAMVYAADNGAVISQNSWSYTSPGFYEQEILDAIDYFIAEAGQYEGSPMKGGLVVFSAGNNGTYGEFYPGAYEPTIAVAASNAWNLPTSYTNHGEWVDILAPGGEYDQDELGAVLSAFPNNRYGYLQGTSMAAPHVSGVAALIISEYGGEDFTAQELEDRLLTLTARFEDDMHPYYEGKVGVGLLNAFVGLTDNENIKPDPVTDLATENVYHDQFDITWTVPEDGDDGQPNFFLLWLNHGEFTEDNYDLLAPYLINNSFEAGNTVKLTVAGVRPNTPFHMAIKSLDRWGNESALSDIVKVVTTDAPKFIFDQEEFTFDIDVASNNLGKETITISNDKAGKLIWAANSAPKSYDPELDEDESGLDGDNPKNVALSYSEDGQPRLTFNLLKSATGQIGYASPENEGQKMELQAVGLDQDEEVKNLLDVTKYRGGLANDYDEDPSFVVGPVNGSTTMSFAHATRFHVPLDYQFSLTHVAAMTYLTIMDQPIIVEIRKGGNYSPAEGETIHAQEFYPLDSGLAWSEIPLTRNFVIEGGDVFWVIFHHPAGEPYPITANVGDGYNYHFFISEDEGRSWYNLQDKGALWPRALKVRALSAGYDPTYLYVDKVEGELEAGESETLTVYADASVLRNGKHVGTVGFYTNDDDYPSASIYATVNVTGHVPELVHDNYLDFGGTYVGRTNRVDFEMSNNGLGDLEIFGYSSSNPEFTVAGDFSNTIRLSHQQEHVFQFVQLPSAVGVSSGTITFDTNIGDIDIPVAASATLPAQPSIVQSALSADVDYGESTTVSFDLTNNGQYPLSFSIPTSSRDKYAEGITEYEVIDSNDPLGPEAGTFQDIYHIGTSVTDVTLAFAVAFIEIDFDFPFYDQVLRSVGISAEGYLVFGDWRQAFPDSLPAIESGKGAIGGMWTELDPVYNKLIDVWGGDVVYANFSDRLIVQYEQVTRTGFLSSDVPGRATFQIVLFQSGDIEIRYKDVDSFEYLNEALVGIQDFTETRGITYDKANDSEILIEDGLVVRFKKVDQAPFIESVDKPSGLIMPGGSEQINVTLNSKTNNLYDGSYTNMLRVFSNGAPEYLELPITLNVTGMANPSLETTSIEFEDTQLGQTVTESFVLVNEGTKSVEITQVDVPNNSFELLNHLPVVIGAESDYRLLIDFAPISIGDQSGDLTIHVDNGDQFILPIIAAGVEDPAPSVDRSIVSLKLKTGEEIEEAFEITNNSSTSPLTYTVMARNNGKAKHDLLTAQNATGFGDYGYSWVDNVEDSELVRFAWQDVGQEENQLTVGADIYRAEALPFDFPYYGEVYDSIWICENGFVTLLEPDELANDTYYLEFKEDAIYGMIAPLWGGWTSHESDPTAGIFMAEVNGNLIVQWNRMRNSSSGFPGIVSFQLILQPDGRIKFQYDDVDSYDGELNFGLESPDQMYSVDLGRDGLDYPTLFDYPFPNARAILLTPPHHGEVEAGGSADFEVIFDAIGKFDGGPYRDTLYVSTNSNAIPLIEIPIELTVEGSARLDDVDDINFGEILLHEELEYEQEMVVRNSGTKALSIESLVFVDLDDIIIYDEGGSKILTNSRGELYAPIEVEPKSETMLKVQLSPENTGLVEGQLTLGTDAGSIDIGVSAEVLMPPVINVEGGPWEHYINSTEQRTETFSISNNGESNLDVEVSAAYLSIPGQKIPDYDEDSPVDIVDSLHYDQGETSPNLWYGRGGVPVVVATHFTAPESGFLLTHYKALVYYIANGLNLTVEVYRYKTPEDGDLQNNAPLGELIQRETTRLDLPQATLWVTVSMDEPIYFEPNEEFMIVVTHPPLYGGQVAYDLSDRPEAYQKHWFGAGNDIWYRFTGESNFIIKQRLLTSAAGGDWLSLDESSALLKPGESMNVTATIDGAGAYDGLNSARINIVSNDPDNPKKSINIDVTRDSSPIFEYTPHQYGETISLEETAEGAYNFLASDPEGQTLTFSISEDAPEFASINNIGNGLAQVILEPGYYDQGQHTMDISVTDVIGNVTRTDFTFKVINKNRPPVVDSLGVIEMQLEGDLLRIGLLDHITDPDNDTLYFFLSNYHPDVVEVIYGDDEVILYPKNPGRALLVYGADDLKENGFAYQFFDVLVSEDGETVVSASTTLSAFAYPNPADSETTIEFDIEDQSNVKVELYSLYGQKVFETGLTHLPEGSHKLPIDLRGLNPGIYINKIYIDGELTESIKVMVK